MLSAFFSPKLQNSDESSMPGIVFHALTNIVKLLPKRQKEFRDACQAVIDRIMEEDAALKPGAPLDTEADKYFYPFKLACEDKRAKVRLYALDAISKMISYGYLVGNKVADPALYPPTVHSAKAPAPTDQTAESAPPASAAAAGSSPAPNEDTSTESATEDSTTGGSDSVVSPSSQNDSNPSSDADAESETSADLTHSEGLPTDESTTPQTSGPSTGSSASPTSSAPSTNTVSTNGGPVSVTAMASGAAPRARRRLLIDAIIESVYDCCTSDDEAVQLQVIRCFVNACSAASCQVHDHSLLLTVRACYHIYLTSRSHINRDTAKAALYQMLNTAFQRMETLAAHISFEQSQREQRRAARRAARLVKPEEKTSAELSTDVSSVNGLDDDFDDDDDDDIDGASTTAATSQSTSDESRDSINRRNSGPASVALSLISPSSDPRGIPISAAHAAAYAAARAEDDESGVSSTITPHLDPALLAADPGYMVSPLPSPVAGGKRNQQEPAAAPQLVQAEEKTEEEPKPLDANESKADMRRRAREARERLTIKLATLQQDAYQIFRALCKLASKPVTEDTDYPTRSKILSLELLHSILRNPGPTLCFFPPFVTLIRDELLYALAVNCLLPVEEVYRLAAAIWRSLVLVFRQHIKLELCTFMSGIVLEILAHPNTSFDHRMTALDVIVSMARDPRLIVDLYLNYDCDEKYPDLFRQITTALEKMAKSRGNELITREEEAQLRALAMEGQNSIMRSIVIWSRDALAHLNSTHADKMTRAGFKFSSREVKGNPLDKDDYLYDAVRTLGPKSAPGPMAVPYATVGANGEMVPPSDLSESKAQNPEDGTPEKISPVGLQKSISATMASLKDAPAAYERTGPQWEAAERRFAKFEEARRRKHVIELAIHKINDKPKTGFAYLVSNKILRKDPHEFAAFVIETPGLDRVVMGEYFGDADPFSLDVLKAYAELSDFTGLTLDAAISKYFSKFLVRGEAQRIDRAIQIFANKYCSDNPGVFRSADGCWILSFSTVMLHSDAHSPGVKHRMTKEEFFRNNRGLDDKHDFNPQMMSSLYDRVTTEGLKIEDVVQDRKNWQALPPRRRQLQYMADTQRLTRQWVEAIKRRLALFRQAYDRKTKVKDTSPDQPSAGPQPNAATNSAATDLPMAANGRCLRTALAVERERAKLEELTMYEAVPEDIESVRSMFDVVWQSACATFSILLEETEDARVIQLCLDGFRYAIRIASTFQADVAREALVNSLTKCTQLGTQREIRPKNIEAIKMVLKIAHTEGNYLGQSWAEVLMVISEYERLQIIARSGASGTLDVFQATETHVRRAQTAVSGRAVAQQLHTGGEQVNTREALASKYIASQQIIEKIDPGLVERVFSQSGSLSDSAVIDFIDQLRNVAEFELFSATPSRVISLQKILEVTYYNLSRPYAVWSKVWTILSAFFKRVGCHMNPTVALYGVDVLRQLVTKFIDRPQHVASGLQDIMFEAFGAITSQSPSEDVRELVVQCLATIVASRPNEIREGWYPIFRALSHAAEEQNPRIVSAAFSLVQTILQKYFLYISGGQYEALDECVRALAEFGLNRNLPQISLQAVELLGRCAQHLGNVARAKLNHEPIPTLLPVNSLSGTLPEIPKESTDETAGPSVASPTTSSSSGTSAVSNASTTCSNATTFVAPAPFDGPSQTLNVWVLLLTGLSALVSDPRLEIRTRALQTLFRVLHTNGAHFTPSFWRLVFREVLIPLFDDVRTVGQRKAAMPPLNSTPAPPRPPPPLGAPSSQPQGQIQAHARSASVSGTSPSSGPTSPPAAEGPSPTSSNSSMAAVPESGVVLSTTLSPDQTGGVRRPSVSEASPEGHMRRGSSAGRISDVGLPPTGRPVARAGSVAGPAPGVNTTPTPPPPPPQPPMSPTHTWLQTTCMPALQSLIELFARFHSTVAFILPELLELIGACITQADEDLACIGVKCWIRLLQVTGNDFSVDEWTLIFQHFNRMFTRCLPLELIAPATRRHLGLPSMFEGPFEAISEQVSRASILKSIPLPSLNVAPAPDHPDAVAPVEAESVAKLPFNTAPIVTKCKIQLVLMDGVVDFFIHYFATFHRHPKSKVTSSAIGLALQAQAQGHQDQPETSTSSADTTAPVTPTFIPPVVSALLDEHLFAVLDTLLLAVDFARRFNSDYALRRRLWVAGFLNDRQKLLPELYFHESHAMKLYLTLLVVRLAFEGEAPSEHVLQVLQRAATSAASSPLHQASGFQKDTPEEKKATTSKPTKKATKKGGKGTTKPEDDSGIDRSTQSEDQHDAGSVGAISAPTSPASALSIDTSATEPEASASAIRLNECGSPTVETGSESAASLLCKVLLTEGVVPVVPRSNALVLADVRHRLFDLMSRVFVDYSLKCKEPQDDARRCLDVVLCSVFDTIGAQLVPTQQLEIVGKFMTQFLTLIQEGSQEVRERLARLLSLGHTLTALVNGCMSAAEQHQPQKP